MFQVIISSCSRSNTSCSSCSLLPCSLLRNNCNKHQQFVAQSRRCQHQITPRRSSHYPSIPRKYPFFLSSATLLSKPNSLLISEQTSKYYPCPTRSIPINTHFYHDILQYQLFSTLQKKQKSIQDKPRETNNDGNLKKLVQSSLNPKGSKTTETPKTQKNVPDVEKQYTRKTPLEHILLRPGMYVGPVECSNQSCWVLEPSIDLPSIDPTAIKSKSSTSDTTNVVHRVMTWSEKNVIPALQKIFDEILINASDNHLRNPKTCTRIDVIIDPGCTKQKRSPFISVRNNGEGIPVQIHPKEQLFIPEMLFGHLLTGSNFDDDAKRITGGRHGYGAKLTNIFSKEFTVETCDTNQKLVYQQTWKHNMSDSSPPTVTKSNSKGYTKVSFTPDLARLSGEQKNWKPGRKQTQDGIETISKDDYDLMCRRVHDIAGCTGNKLTVTLNGITVPIADFQTYSQLFGSTSTHSSPERTNAKPILFQKINPRWEVGISLSDSGSFDSVSFVNGMATTRGGTHVNVITQQITQHMAEKLEKLHPTLFKDVSHRQLQSLIRRNMMVFVNALIENPSFDSQMKESLTSSPSSFGSKYTLTDTFMNRLLKEVQYNENGEPNGSGPGILEEVIRMAKGNAKANLLREVDGGKKSNRQILSIPKLDDAHLAGTKDGAAQCTLILTEGDSAKALAVAGLGVIGREKYGVFPLRGKFLNVRDATVSQLANNQELKSLCTILGLQFDKTYDTLAERSKLRYGHVMLMTDQDADGSHIKGLIMNFFRHFWPSLLKSIELNDEKSNNSAENVHNFLSSFVTPLLKAQFKNGKKSLSFYSLAEYEQWRNSLKDDAIKLWNVKYYKGLGTSTPAEAKEYFSAFDQHRLPFRWNSDQDGEQLDMVFDKSRASDRRNWILNEYNADKNSGLDLNQSVSYEDFVNKELVIFSNADNVRSLPSVIDGLKPSQRKVLYACFKRNLKKEMKVAQLAGYCAEHTSYHHGEASLHATIIGMAQDFIGSSNINLLEPSGQFGTRLEGGKDAASPRYVFTRLLPISRKLFPEIDDNLLKRKEDDGNLIEPVFFCPIIPLLLINGGQGIGTGWSTSIPPHNPRDVLNYVKAKLDGKKKLPPVRPWARGFEGNMEIKDDGNGYLSVGKISKISKTELKITELPVGRWTNDYKEFLLRMRDKGEIQSFVEDHTTTSVSFIITMKSVQLTRVMKSGLHKHFRLEGTLPTTNMHAFDEHNTIKKYDRPQDIIDAYFPVRLELYRKRKLSMERSLKYTEMLLENKCRFIQDVSDGTFDIVSKRRSKAEAESILMKLKYDKMSTIYAVRNQNDSNASVSISDVANESEGHKDDEYDDDNPSTDKEYDYLLNMPLSSLTTEKVIKLSAEGDKIRDELGTLENTSPEDLWRADLNDLESYL